MDKFGQPEINDIGCPKSKTDTFGHPKQEVGVGADHDHFANFKIIGNYNLDRI